MASNSKTSPRGEKYFWKGIIGLIVLIVVLMSLFWWMGKKSHMASACAPEHLTLVPGQQNGAAGTIYQHMAFTNKSNKDCTINGYPTAFLYGSDGYALGSAAAIRPQPDPVAITLAPNETANTVLGYPQAGNFPAGVCSSAKSVSVKIYVPGAISPLETPLEVAWCPGFSATAMQPGN